MIALAFGALLPAGVSGLGAAGPFQGGSPLAVVHDAAPEFPKPGASASGTTWINSPPLTMAGLRGKVVLIDFWEYTCINCIRTFAQNKEWYERYHKYGFEIIGVHAPEFDIAYPVENVRAAVKRFGLSYPIVVDDWFTIWKSYHNDSWPMRYLIDSKGVVRYERPGEGGDAAFEHAIQDLLREAHPGLAFPASYTISDEGNSFSAACGIPTQEMYVGSWYGHGTLENREGYHPGETRNYKTPEKVDDGRVGLSGTWESDLNGMIYRGKSQAPGNAAARVELPYHARELYAVLNVARGQPSRLYILQDGKSLTAADKGVDVQIDARGTSYIEVRDSRMYYLVANPSFGSHAVTLIPTEPGLTVNSFTFGNDCQTKFPHL